MWMNERSVWPPAGVLPDRVVSILPTSYGVIRDVPLDPPDTMSLVEGPNGSLRLDRRTGDVLFDSHGKRWRFPKAVRVDVRCSMRRIDVREDGALRFCDVEVVLESVEVEKTSTRGVVVDAEWIVTTPK